MHQDNRNRSSRRASPRRAVPATFPRAARRLLPALALVLCCPLAARAQAPDPFTSARVHIGPFAVNPSISVSNVGVDTNVFYDNQDPKSDFTASVTPAADTWVRFGRARLNVKLSGTYLYYAQYSSQRGPSTTDSARIEFDLIHVRPWAEGSYANLYSRPGYEIDARVRYLQVGYAGGLDLPVSPRTTLGASYRQVRTSYQPGDSYDGYSLESELNRTTKTATASLVYELTPLTRFVLDGDYIEERFEYSGDRDSDGYRVMPGLKFAATALVSGEARVGYRHLAMKTAGVPDYSGLVAQVDLGYTLAGVTRFGLQVKRDVEYSYDPSQPYYLLTGLTGSVTQSVGGPWGISARGGVQQLAYRVAALPGEPAPPARTDVVWTAGGGVTYKFGPASFLSGNVDYYARTSEIDSLQYRGLRIGSSVVFGF